MHGPPHAAYRLAYASAKSNGLGIKRRAFARDSVLQHVGGGGIEGPLSTCAKTEPEEATSERCSPPTLHRPWTTNARILEPSPLLKSGEKNRGFSVAKRLASLTPQGPQGVLGWRKNFDLSAGGGRGR